MSAAVSDTRTLAHPEPNSASLSEHRSCGLGGRSGQARGHTPLVEYGTLLFTKSSYSLPVYCLQCKLFFIKKLEGAFFFFLFVFSVFECPR